MLLRLRSGAVCRAASRSLPASAIPRVVAQPCAAVHVRHTGTFLGNISAWLTRLQDARGWGDGRTYIGSDERGNKYYVKQPTSGMVAESSHCKEIRSIEYAGGNNWKECERSPSRYIESRSPLRVLSRPASHCARALADDPDSVPIEWRLWLSGQQRLPPTIAPPSGANATLDRLAVDAIPAADGATEQPVAALSDAPLKPALQQNLKDSSAGGAVRPYSPQKKYQPQSWGGGAAGLSKSTSK